MLSPPYPVLAGFGLNTYQLFGQGAFYKSKQEWGWIVETNLNGHLHTWPNFCLNVVLSLAAIPCLSNPKIESDSYSLKDISAYLMSFLHLYMRKLSDSNLVLIQI